jgi:hypothetical protein
MRAHRSSCEWFWVWAVVGFGLTLSFVGIFSIGLVVLPFATLLLGAAAARRAAPGTLAFGPAIAVAGIAAGFSLSLWFLAATPLVTLALGLHPAVPRTRTALLRVALIAAIVASCAAAALATSGDADAALIVYPVALAAFAPAAAGRLHAEATGALTGVGLCAALLGGPPAAVLLIAAGIAAFPVMRPPARTAARG